MVAHPGSCCNPATSTARRIRRRAVVPGMTGPPTSAVAPRRPLRTTSWNRPVAGNDGKARTRRCVEVRKKMEALRRLVPSGDGEEADDGRPLDVDELLFRAADYIVRLQVQVKAMQLMVDVLEHTRD